jgi:hypothetical protein
VPPFDEGSQCHSHEKLSDHELRQAYRIELLSNVGDHYTAARVVYRLVVQLLEEIE